MSRLILLKVLPCLLASVIINLADSSMLPTYYGRKCSSTQTLQEREDLADVVFSGRVQAIHRNKFNSSYHCDIRIFRVIKGEDIIADLLSLPASLESLYTKTIVLSGFGTDKFCDTQVQHGDTRIFLAAYSYFGYPSKLSLSSSPIRIGVRTLHRSAIVHGDSDESGKEAAFMLTECKYFFCSFYAECKLGLLTGDPYCECPSCENELPQQVCGSDGKLYDNDCEVRKAACIRRKRVKPSHPRWCEMKSGTSDSPTNTTSQLQQTTSQAKTTVISPTTTSTTLEVVSPTISAKENPCDLEKCEYGAVCSVSKDGLLARCECPYTCEDYGDSMLNMPVCGTNGVDYENECMLRKESCSLMTNVTVEKLGNCEPCANVTCPLGRVCVVGEFNAPVCECSTECEDFSAQLPVCGTDGRSYDNKCLLDYAACLRGDSQPKLTVAYDGSCRFEPNPCLNISCTNYASCRVNEDGTPTCRCPETCPLTKRTVCGSNNITYDNLCRLQRDACALQTNITAVANQDCSENPCLNYKCPHDGVCEMNGANAVCTCPLCTGVIEPVCGTDGITYTNLCSLKQTNCLGKKNVMVSNLGACGQCNGKSCEFGVCLNTNGACVCPVDEDCVDTHSPVCADGTTYSSRCQLKLELCRQQKKVQTISDGACDGNSCTRVTPCKYRGVCLGTECLCNFGCDDKVKLSVCGSNGKTYVNKCFLEEESCTEQVLITVANSSVCDDKMGGSVDSGTAGGNPGDAGHIDETVQPTTATATCDMDTNCRYEGQCDYTDGPPGVCRCTGTGFFQYCEEDDAAACGSNGVLYRNLCELREAQCLLQKEILPKPTAFCNTTVTTDGTPSVKPTTTDISDPQHCPNFQLPLMNAEGIPFNCSSCLPNNVGQCEICLSDISYCNPKTSACCPKVSSLPDCTYSQFGCCPDNNSLPSPGPDDRGCPYTCECHEFGSNSRLCDAFTFQCDCKLGVVGKTCDQCKLGWYGLRFIQTAGTDGCLPCQCNEWGSVRVDCEQDNGRCLCKTGVTGLKCDSCVEDGMIFTENGCVKPVDSLDLVEAIKSCDTLDCGIEKCVVVNSTAICTCDYDCEDTKVPVCGSNGLTYSNKCFLDRQVCQTGIAITYVDGECDTPVAGTTKTTKIPTSIVSAAGTSVTPRFDPERVFLADDANRHSIGVSVKSGTTPSQKPVTCKDNPCLNMGTCVPDDHLGVVCICHINWQGARCEQGNIFDSPKFNGESFMQYIWEKSLSSFDLRLTLIPTLDTGIILYAGDESGRGDFLSLVLRDGFVEFRFNTGGDSVLLRSEKRLSTNRRHEITAKRVGAEGFLYTADQTPVVGKAAGNHTNLDVEPLLYIGHATSSFRGKLPKRLVRNLGGVKKGFSGCVSMLHDAAANGNKNFLLGNSREAQILDGRNVGQCDSDPCLQAPCTHGVCTMVDSFSYKCDCFGSYTGVNCDSKSKKIRDLLRGDDSRPYNEVVWSGESTSTNGKEGKVFELPRFTGRSYIQYKLTQEVDYNLTLDMVFRTDQADGVLFFGCQSSDSLVSGDYILLSVEDRLPVVRLDLGSGTNTLRLQEKVVLKDWNMISLRRNGKQISLALNMEPAMNITYSGEMMYLNVDNYVTLGAIPHTLEHTKGFLHSPGLRGVIQRVSINGDDILDFFHSTHGQYRVKKYHGPPCHPNPCSRGTICIPLLNTYKCDLI